MILFCSGCHHPSTKALCGACEESFYWNGRILPSPTPELEGLAPLLFSFDRMQVVLRRWKESGGSSLEERLLRIPKELARALREKGFAFLVPVPQSRKRNLARRHDPVETVAHHLSRELGLESLPLLGLRNPDPPRQTGRARFERDMIPQPFRIAEGIDWGSGSLRELAQRVDQGKEIRILLVDDLITSGNTLARASIALKEFLPGIRCWGAALGYRPGRQHGPESRANPAPNLPPFPRARSSED